MASCITSQWGDSYSPQIRLTVTQTDSTNTSATLSWKLEYVPHGYPLYISSRNYTVKIGGSTVKSGTYNANGVTSTKTISSGTKTITKTTSKQNISFSVSFTFNATWSGSYAGTKSASGNITVSAKPSYKISYNANGGSGAPSSQTKWYGQNLTLSSTKPTRTGYSFLGWSTSSSATSATWTAGGTYTANAADTLYAVWKANTYTVKYNANGGSGAPGNQTKTYGKTLTLSSVKPTKTNYNFKGWGTSASSTTVSYAPGASYTKNASITLYAIWELAYTPPRIKNLSVDRCNVSGELGEEGTYALVVFNWETDESVVSVKIEWKASSDETYSKTIMIPSSGTSGSVSEIIGEGLLNTEYVYNILVSIEDQNGASSSRKNLPQIAFIIDFLAEGKGVAFGKPAEEVATLDVNMYLRNRKDVQFETSVAILGIKPSTGELTDVFTPQNASGNTVIGYGNYEKKQGYTNIYGNDIQIASAEADGYFRPYYRKGDTIPITFRGSGFVTTSSTYVGFTVPLSKPIIGKPVVTARSVNGFILRQNGKYTHGSDGSPAIWVTPSKYEVDFDSGFIMIGATFSNTTNVTNNDSIGIYWIGEIVLS